MTLTEFLLARIAEDEAVARAAIERDGDHWATESLGHDGSRINGTVDKGNPRAYSGSPELWDDEGALGMHDETAAHIVRWDPARVLRECAAKRAIVEAMVEHDAATGEEPAYYWVPPVLGIFASVDANHPDYDEDWQV